MNMPWYRQPLVLMLILIPLSAVIGGFVTLYLAIHSDDGLVEDDYYQRGKEINRVLDRDRAAARYGLQGRVLLNVANRAIQVQLSATAPANPDRLELKLLHATRAGLDHTLTLTRTANGVYAGELPHLADGHWYLQLAAADWRLNGELRLPTETTAVLAPTP